MPFCNGVGITVRQDDNYLHIRQKIPQGNEVEVMKFHLAGSKKYGDIIVVPSLAKPSGKGIDCSVSFYIPRRHYGFDNPKKSFLRFSARCRKKYNHYPSLFSHQRKSWIPISTQELCQNANIRHYLNIINLLSIF
jgi:hypothetical protein